MTLDTIKKIATTGVIIPAALFSDDEGLLNIAKDRVKNELRLSVLRFAPRSMQIKALSCFERMLDIKDAMEKTSRGSNSADTLSGLKFYLDFEHGMINEMEEEYLSQFTHKEMPRGHLLSVLDKENARLAYHEAQTARNIEAVAEEPVAEEAVAEEAVVEDAVVEDAVVEDAVVEDANDDEAVAEETATTEVVADEVVVEDANDDTSDDEAVADEVVADEVVADEVVVEDANDDDAVAVEVVADEVVADEVVADEVVADEVVADDAEDDPSDDEADDDQAETISLDDASQTFMRDDDSDDELQVNLSMTDVEKEENAAICSSILEEYGLVFEYENCFAMIRYADKALGGSEVTEEARKERIYDVMKRVLDATDTPFVIDALVDPLIMKLMPSLIDVAISKNRLGLSGIVTLGSPGQAPCHDDYQLFFNALLANYKEGFQHKDIAETLVYAAIFIDHFEHLDREEKLDCVEELFCCVLDNTDTPLVPDFIADPILKILARPVLEFLLE